MHRCHKVVLAQSPFLKILLIDDDKDDEVKIFTPDVPGSIVSLILDAPRPGPAWFGTPSPSPSTW